MQSVLKKMYCLRIHTRGVVRKNGKLIYELADKLIPFLWGIIRSTQNFKILGGLEVLSLDIVFPVSDIPQNTKEKSPHGIFYFFL